MDGRVIRWVLMLLGAGILAAFIRTADVSSVLAIVGGTNRAALVLAGLVSLGAALVRGVRWKLIVRGIAGTDIAGSFAFKSYLAGVAAGYFVPGRAMEVAKPMMLKSQYGVPLGTAISGMIFERILEALMILAVLATGSMLVQDSLPLPVAVIWMISLAIVAGTVLLVVWPGLMKRAVHKVPLPVQLRNRMDATVGLFVHGVQRGRKAAVAVPLMALSILAVLLDVARLLLVFRLLGVGTPIAVTVTAYALANIIGLAALIPGGVGVTEFSQASLLLLMTPGASSSEMVKSAVLLDRTIGYYWIVITGTIVLMLQRALVRAAGPPAVLVQPGASTVDGGDGAAR